MIRVNKYTYIRRTFLELEEALDFFRLIHGEDVLSAYKITGNPLIRNVNPKERERVPSNDDRERRRPVLWCPVWGPAEVSLVPRPLILRVTHSWNKANIVISWCTAKLIIVWLCLHWNKENYFCYTLKRHESGQITNFLKYQNEPELLTIKNIIFKRISGIFANYRKCFKNSHACLKTRIVNNANLRCHQWRMSWHCDTFWVLMHVMSMPYYSVTYSADMYKKWTKSPARLLHALFFQYKRLQDKCMRKFCNAHGKAC